jgi:DNA-directed RNA polymerase specialized sigma24 family protein
MGYVDNTHMGGARQAFLTTQWSLIENIQAGEDQDQALINSLLTQYWKPVYCYLRRQGHDSEQAKDLTQGFFHEVVLNRDLVGRADHSRGRFRSFLLHALKQYVGHQKVKQRARQRIPREKLVSLDIVEEPILPDSVAQTTAEASFHYAWLSSLLEQVLKEVKEACEEQDMAIHWALFNKRVVRPTFGDRSPPSLSELCEFYEIGGVKKASNMIVTVKRRFRTALLQHVRNTVLSHGQAAEELEELLQFFPKSAQHFE